MPRYFFHLIELVTDEIDVDTDGVELPDADAARAEAVKVAGEMLRDTTLRRDIRWRDQTFLILDEKGERVALVPFSLALRQ